jgi:hypothetical protein
MAREVIYRCSDGHLYTASWGKALMLSVHLGVGRHYQRCPVDDRWRMAERIDPGRLSPAEREAAEQSRF